MSWMDGLGKQGKLTGGLPLGAEGKVVAKHGQAITDGPFTEGKEVVGGYLIVKANDLNEATEISKGCPLFEHNVNGTGALIFWKQTQKIKTLTVL
jgi:hypothetical protein